MIILTDDQAAAVLDALATGREYIAEALSEYIEKYDDHPAAVAGQKIISESLQEVLDALAILDSAQRVEQVGWCHDDGDDSLISCSDKEVNTVDFSERYLAQHSIPLYAMTGETK